MKKSLFTSMVKRNVRTATFNALQKMQSSHKKINTIQYNRFGLQEYLKRKFARTALIKGRTAYQGYPVLDASTPADVGGAGERIGIPDSTPNMPYTCVSSRYSRKCVTLLNLMMELIFLFYFLNTYFWTIFLKRTLH